jgi:hypothetical protein
MSLHMIAALLMVVVVMGHNVNNHLDANLYPFPDSTSRDSQFRQKLDSLRRMVEDDGPMAEKHGVLGWHQPEYSDAAPSPYVQPNENAHASPPSDPFHKPANTDPRMMRFTEKSAHVRLHKPTVLPHNTVFAETKATREAAGVAAQEGVEAGTEAGTEAGQGGILDSVLGAVGSVVGKLTTALTPQAKPEDIEDCVACRYVWLQVEMDVGNSQIESNIYDSFKAHCRDAQLSRIFFPACQDMFDAVDDMIGDYMDGFTVNQMCENSRICR